MCAYRNLIYLHEADKGGHFAAGQPELFASELRAAFRPLRRPSRTDCPGGMQ